MLNIKALISDADGTLIDTVQLIRHGQYEAANKYLTEHGIPASEIPTYETYNSLLSQVVGGSTRNTTESTVRLLYAASPHHLERINFDELYSMLAPIQDNLAPKYVKPYEGLQPFLHELSKQNINLAVFSSGSAHHIVRNFGIALPELGMRNLHQDEKKSDTDKLRILERKFAEFFAIPGFTIVSSEDTAKHKPEPDSLILAMRRLGVEPSEVVAMGDHKVDMQAAASAKVEKIIGIAHGFDSEEDLRAHGAAHIAHSLDDALRIMIAPKQANHSDGKS